MNAEQEIEIDLVAGPWRSIELLAKDFKSLGLTGGSIYTGSGKIISEGQIYRAKKGVLRTERLVIGVEPSANSRKWHGLRVHSLQKIQGSWNTVEFENLYSHQVSAFSFNRWGDLVGRVKGWGYLLS